MTPSTSSGTSTDHHHQQQQGQGEGVAATCQAGHRAGGTRCAQPCGELLPFWDATAVDRISRHPAVEGVVAIGTVLAVELRQRAQQTGSGSSSSSGGGNCDGGARTAADGSSTGGYLASGSAAVVAALRAQGVFARPLGSTVYIMVTPTTEAATCRRLMSALESALEAH